jgi:CPA2 family monovalent cation:H+ antiporter-2
MASGSLLSHTADVTRPLIKGPAVFFLLLFVGRLLIRPLFRYIAGLRSPELFMLAVLCVSVGAAQFAQVTGLSLALGGFMAGMVVGETEFKHQVEADIRPFQDVLLGLFFITVGMLVDLGVIGQIWVKVMLVTAAIVAIKFVLIFSLTRLTGTATRTAIRTGISLAHAGEFSLVILFLAMDIGLFQDPVGQIVLAAVLLSMAIAPVLIRYSATLTETVAGAALGQTPQVIGQDVETRAQDLSSHVILCGYGGIGRHIAWYLAEENVEFIALDLDLNRLRQPAEGYDRVSYGDATRRQILIAAGLERAQAVVVTFRDLRASLKILGHVHELRPDITTIVRAADEETIDQLLDAGATEVVPDPLETSITMATYVLTLLGVPVARVAERSDRVRADRYRLFRGVFHGREAAHGRDRLRVITLGTDAYAAGRSLSEMRLDDDYGVTVTAVRRKGIRGADPDPHMRLQPKDTLVVHGTADDLARAERYLLKGQRTD